MTDFNEQHIERLSAYLDGMLNQAERLEVEALLNIADSPHQAELESLRRTVDLVKGLPIRKAPRSFVLTREMAGLPPLQAVKHPIRAKQINFYAMSFLSAAASFIMVVLAAVMWTSNSNPAQKDLGAVASAPTFAVTQQQADDYEALMEIEPASGSMAFEEEPEGASLGSLIGGAVGQGGASEATFPDASDMSIEQATLDEMPQVFSAVPPPVVFPPMDSAYDEDDPFASQAPLMDGESGDATETMFRSAPIPDGASEESIAIEASAPIEEASVATFSMDEVSEEIAIEEIAVEEESATVEPSDDIASELPTIAVIFLVIGGLFALMAVTAIYWARKIRE